MAIKKVAVAGAGQLGTKLLSELVKAGFTVTQLSRSSTAKSELPEGVVVQEVDYDSIQSLETALTGQDALVSTVAQPAISKQKLMIETAVRVGVKHVIPADYGSFTTDPRARSFPVIAPNIAIQDLLKAKCSNGSNTRYSIVACGAFLEMFLNAPLLMDFENRAVTIYDSGDNPIGASQLGSIARAIAGILRNSERYANRAVYISDADLTQNKLLEMAKRHSGEEEWKVSHADAEKAVQGGLEALANGDHRLEVYFSIFAGVLTGGRFTAAYDKVDNADFGLESLSDGDIEQLVARRMRGETL